jgi:integrase/recombinase XerC
MSNRPLLPTSTADGSVVVSTDPFALAVPYDDVPPMERLFLHWLKGRNPATIVGYRSDLADLAAFMRRPDGEPLVPQAARRTPAEAAHAAQVAIQALVTLGNAQGVRAANAFVLAYRAHLLDEKVAPRTVNRRMSAIRSMLKMARMIGLVTWTIEIENERVTSVKDTRGPGKDAVVAMMGALVKRAQGGDRHAFRDLAILRLLYDLGLRRGEIASLDLEHWEPKRRRLLVWGKKRVEREPIDDVPLETARSLDAWVAVRGVEPGPLFLSFDRRSCGHRLTGWSIWSLITELASSLDLDARPHGVRHTAITEVLNESRGDVRAAQRFSRHKRLETLQVYDDNRENLGGQLAAKIAADMPGLDVNEVRTPYETEDQVEAEEVRRTDR